jgi:hypothetical protein
MEQVLSNNLKGRKCTRFLSSALIPLQKHQLHQLRTALSFQRPLSSPSDRENKDTKAPNSEAKKVSVQTEVFQVLSRVLPFTIYFRRPASHQNIISNKVGKIRVHSLTLDRKPSAGVVNRRIQVLNATIGRCAGGNTLKATVIRQSPPKGSTSWRNVRIWPSKMTWNVWVSDQRCSKEYG